MPDRILTRIKQLGRRILGREPWLVPQLRCGVEMHGTDYGGWAILNDSLTWDSVVYSIGVGQDISFDLSIIAKYGVDVYAFDPTPWSAQWVKGQSLPPQFHFIELGIADFDGTAQFYAPQNPSYVSYSINRLNNQNRSIWVNAQVRRLGGLMNELGHSHINLLKMDIEGAEYQVLPDILRSGIVMPQLLVEFHHRTSPGGVQATRDAVRLMNTYGYRLFNVSLGGDEYAFLRD